MSDLVPYTSPPPDRGFAADWLRDPAEIARVIGSTDFVPQGLRGNAPAITAALLYGEEVGLKPMQSLARIAVINGRPTLAAEAQRALILRAGHELWVEEWTITRCTVAGRRRNSDEVSRVTWTTDDAKRAGLAGRQAWRLYPRPMLLARASAELARAIFPDAIGGMYATEELEDSPDLAAVDNGATAAAPAAEKASAEKPTTKRRRARTSAPAPPTPSPSEPGPTPASGPLPPEEQQLIDELERDFDARQVKPEPEPDVPPMTDAQRRKMMALFSEKGIGHDRRERLAFSSRVVGRSLASSTDLNMDEAKQVIDALEEHDSDDPPWATYVP